MDRTRISLALALLMAAALFVATGCQSKAVKKEMTNIKIAYLEIEKLWNEGDLSVADQVYAPGMVLHFRGKSYPFGPEEAKKTVSAWRTAFPDSKFKIEDILSEGNKVAVRYKFTGTHQGKFWGIPPTAKTISVTQINIVRFENGKMAEGWEDYDEAGMKAQLGMVLVPVEEYASSLRE